MHLLIQRCFKVHNTDWFGHSSYNLTGIDNTVGAIRTLSGETSVGYLTFFEALYAYNEKKDGSFTHAYELVHGKSAANLSIITRNELRLTDTCFTVPLKYNNSFGVGEFYGDWDILQVRAKGRSRTDIIWSIYACFTPDGGFTPFHESAINNITSLLTAQGKMKELTTPVYSVEYADEKVFAKYR